MTVKKASTKKIVAKPAARKSAAKPAAKVAKVAYARPVIRKPVAKIKPLPAGWGPNAGGRIVIEQANVLIPASKLRKGLSAAQAEIKESLQEIATLLSLDFEVSEIELSISFSADGKFLGFGVGGATSIKVKIRPIEE